MLISQKYWKGVGGHIVVVSVVVRSPADGATIDPVTHVQTLLTNWKI